MKFSLPSIVLVAIITASFSFGKEFVVTIPVDEYNCSLSGISSGASITIEGVPGIGIVGAPILPAVPLKLALPTANRAISIRISEISYSSGEHLEYIPPMSRPVPTSWEHTCTPAIPDPAIYEQNEFFPSTSVVLTGSGVLWGIPIATLTMYPARWNPISHRVEYIESLTLTVETEYHPDVVRVSRRTADSENRSIDILRKLVVNPEDVSASGAAIVQPRDLQFGQYVVICPAEYQEEFQVLADWKTSKGIPTAVYTTDWVTTNYSYGDQPQNIRAFLTDCISEGTDYALLGGDDDVLEARQVILSSLQISRPSDLYFIDINDTNVGVDNWDSNNNSIWGESYDSVEWHPDIFTGRASVNSEAEAELFVNKVLYYEHVLETWASNPCSRAPVEMRIGYSTGAYEYGASDTLWGSTDAELISSMIPDTWQEEKRYESDGNNSAALTIEMINMGMNQVLLFSHGGYWGFYTSYGDIMDTTHVSNLENISLGGSVSIWNSTACCIGSFDSLTCVADAWLNSPDGGGFGSFNTHYGYYSGISAAIVERFFQEYTVNDVYNHGIAHSLAIDYFCPPDWYSATEDVVKGYNLFGDPELPMWTEEPIDLWVMHQPAITGNTTLSVVVTSQGVALEGARVCVQKGDWQTGEVYDAAVTDVTGMAQVWAAPETTDPITITVWAHNHNLYTGEIQVLETGLVSGAVANVTLIESVSPAPVHSEAAVKFSTSELGLVKLNVFDLQGREVETLVTDVLEAGSHSYNWNLEDGIASGIYFVRLSNASQTSTRPVVVLR